MYTFARRLCGGFLAKEEKIFVSKEGRYEAFASFTPEEFKAFIDEGAKFLAAEEELEQLRADWEVASREWREAYSNYVRAGRALSAFRANAHRPSR